jgi:glycosyltransferase involved in cell wall biosynthesis
MNISIRQVRGNSGIDVWAQNLCAGIQRSGHRCILDQKSSVFEFFPGLLSLFPPEKDTDIIHGNSWNAFAFKKEQPLVVTEHHVVHDPAYFPYRTLPQTVYHRWVYQCERRSFDVADAVTCVSQYSRKKLEESFGFQDSQVIYNGVDTTVFKPTEQINDAWNIPHDKTVLFFAGNLSRRKGADLLPAIMKNLGEDYVLLLATGQKGASFGFMNNIINIGHLDLAHLIMAYNRCDIFLSASRLEGFGLSVAEAMACGKPVVATNGSSLPELVVEGKGGFLCEMDNVKDFAGKIRYLAENEQERRVMGTFNHARVIENFDVVTMVKAYIALYHHLITNQ